MKREEPNDNERPWVNLSGEDTTIGEDSVRNWNGPTVNVGDSDEPGSADGTGGQAPASNQYYSRYYGMLLEAYKAGSLEEKYKTEKNELVNGMLNNMENWSPELRKIQKQKIKAIDQAYAEIKDPDRTHICAGCGTNIAPLLAKYPNMKICPVCSKNIERIKTKEEKEEEARERQRQQENAYAAEKLRLEEEIRSLKQTIANNEATSYADRVATDNLKQRLRESEEERQRLEEEKRQRDLAAWQQENERLMREQEQLRLEEEKRKREEEEKTPTELSKEADSLYDAKRYSKALSKYLEAYYKGYRGDEVRIGYMYNYGQGIEKNYTEAVKWYWKVAEWGNAVAQNNLGVMYKNGWGVEQNYAEAVKWYRKAAEQGEAWGQNNLGNMYENGWSVEQNYSEAVRWYMKSAEQGNAAAQSNLGNMYRKGYGVDKDDVEAVKWYMKSAEQGNSNGQSNLGYMYLNGKGVNKDYSESAKWFAKAAAQGNALGQYNIGVMYENGFGVDKDEAEAIKWYEKAAAQGDEDAKNNLKRLREHDITIEEKSPEKPSSWAFIKNSFTSRWDRKIFFVGLLSFLPWTIGIFGTILNVFDIYDGRHSILLLFIPPVLNSFILSFRKDVKSDLIKLLELICSLLLTWCALKSIYLFGHPTETFLIAVLIFAVCLLSYGFILDVERMVCKLFLPLKVMIYIAAIAGLFFTANKIVDLKPSDNSAAISNVASVQNNESEQNSTEAAKAEEERKRKEAEAKAAADAAAMAEEAERQRKAEEAKHIQVQQVPAQQAATTSLARKTSASKYKVGDIITFGSYPFYADGGKKDIDWIILDIDRKGNALVISDYALDNVKYNEKDVDITWEDSSIRKWLNNDFLNKAFSPEQRRKIISSRITNNDNAEYGTKGGNDTRDKLFLLSIDEARKYFKSNDDRKAYPTPYAKRNKSVNGNLYVSEKYVSKYRGGSCWWWLRSPGFYWEFAARVNDDGNVSSYGNQFNNDHYAVRPALWIDLSKLKKANQPMPAVDAEFEVSLGDDD